MKAPVPPVPTGRELLEQFRSCTILPSHFGHAQHIEVAWHYVRRWPLLEAMARFDRDLEKLATHLGATNFHRTITCAFLVLIHDHASRLPRDHTFETFRTHAMELFEGSRVTLAAHYSAERLADAEARRSFVLPDLCPASHDAFR